MQRRSFVKRAGVVTIAVIGGVVWRAYETGVVRVGRGPAYEPWHTWRDEGDGPLALVRAAILAANPFNTQPWLFRVTPSRVDLYADNARNTGAFDPYLRELRIGLGCAIENMMLAAPATGSRPALTILPGRLGPSAGRPDRELVARIELVPGPREETELYRAIPDRHTNRSPYDVQRPIPSAFLAALERIAADERDVTVRLFTADDDRTRFVRICSQSVIEDAGDTDARSGTVRWIRDWRSLQDAHDGASIDESGLPPLVIAAEKFFPPPVMAMLPQPSTLSYTNLISTGRLCGLIAVRDLYDQEQTVRAGRIWQRLHLLATARGLAARPANQPVQLVDHEQAQGKPAQMAEFLTQLTNDTTWRPTFMFYMGYPTRAANRSARRGVREVVI